MNFRRVLSKSSLRSSNSSGKSINKIDEIKKLHQEIESLNLNTSSLKVLLESRDAAIGNLAREKEKLYIEHKKLQRTNTTLQQQLIDERKIHSREKDFLLDSMKRLSLKLANSKNSNVGFDEEHISALQNEITSKDEIVYNVCKKYFKLKKSKEELQMKFEVIQKHMHKAFGTIVTSLEDNKNSLDLLLDELRISAEIHPSRKKYIKLLKVNADLHFENAQLKLFLIAKNEFDPKTFEQVSELAELQSYRSNNRFYAHENMQQRVKNYAEYYIRRNTISASKLVGVFSKLNKIRSFSRYNRIPYTSLSDSFLPRNIYK